MDETNLDIFIRVECFDTVCRICLQDLKQKKVFNINRNLFENIEEASSGKETLIIKDIISRCASIEVSKFLLLIKDINRRPLLSISKTKLCSTFDTR